MWRQIEPLIEGLPLVAHNSPFDEGCLKAVYQVYQMDYPDYQFENGKTQIDVRVEEETPHSYATITTNLRLCMVEMSGF